HGPRQLLQGAEVDAQGDPRSEEERRVSRRPQAVEGSPQGQPHAVARVHVEPHEPVGQARDAPGLVPDHGSDDPGHRARQARGGPGARQRADRRGPAGADDLRAARPPEPAPRAPPALAGPATLDFFPTAPCTSSTLRGPTSRKAMMRHGHASPPSNFQGKAPMMQRVLRTFSMSPPTFSAWMQPSGKARQSIGKMS